MDLNLSLYILLKYRLLNTNEGELTHNTVEEDEDEVKEYNESECAQEDDAVHRVYHHHFCFVLKYVVIELH